MDIGLGIDDSARGMDRLDPDDRENTVGGRRLVECTQGLKWRLEVSEGPADPVAAAIDPAADLVGFAAGFDLVVRARRY